MGYGGATWDTAGTLELDAPNTFNQDDADDLNLDDYAFHDEGWWVYSPTFHHEGRVRTGDGLTGYVVLSGPDEPHAELVTYRGSDGVGDFYWFIAGRTYHIAVGNLTAETGLTYQVFLDNVVPLATTTWYDDLKNRTDNILESNEREGPYGVATTRGRDKSFGITRAIDSPEMSDIGCAWLHAHFGSEGAIIWNGVCPPVFPGTTPSTNPFNPYKDADFSVSHGGSARVNLHGGAIHAWEVHNLTPPNGVLPLPDPLTNTGVYLNDYELEWEDQHVKIRGIEFAGDDRPTIPQQIANAEAADEEWTAPSDVGITYRDEHVIPAPFKVVPISYNTEDGQYEYWPKGGLSSDVTLDSSGVPTWTTLYGSMTGEGTDWSYFFFPEEGSSYAPGDYVFGAAIESVDNDLGGPEDERPSYTLCARFSLQAARYRFIYKPETTTIPPRRIFGRSDGATHGARRALGGGNTRQSGSRTLGSIL